MKWVTRQYVHLDRVAVPWLISRFIDPEAEFVFVPWGREDERPADAIPFAIPGVELGPHDASGTTFDKVLAKYGVDDPAVTAIANVVRTGVACATRGYRPGPEDRFGQTAVGMLEIAEGMLLDDGGDLAILETSFPIYDALYRTFKCRHLVEQHELKVPTTAGKGPQAKYQFLRALLRDGQ